MAGCPPQPKKARCPLTLRSIASDLGRSKQRAARERRAQPCRHPPYPSSTAPQGSASPPIPVSSPPPGLPRSHFRRKWSSWEGREGSTSCRFSRNCGEKRDHWGDPHSHPKKPQGWRFVPSLCPPTRKIKVPPRAGAVPREKGHPVPHLCRQVQPPRAAIAAPLPGRGPSPAPPGVSPNGFPLHRGAATHPGPPGEGPAGHRRPTGTRLLRCHHWRCPWGWSRSPGSGRTSPCSGDTPMGRRVAWCRAGGVWGCRGTPGTWPCSPRPGYGPNLCTSPGPSLNEAD